ncbi:hypothetical protein CRI94_08420 [Longibacter salinarum]|uniref:Uncharacterized protein n=1 Tax=Longibacter salinarum TaxID=1850348 RepID=A0A2A8CZE6_9BACT|nr:hypothetical protein [Longibacter salinarum]PEN14055.1 hypothetical protein CRI94_08420 [Longibacter salinarum]
MSASIEIYVRDLSKEKAEKWLSNQFGSVEQVRTEPALTYEVDYSGETVRVFVAENIEGGPYTSVWFNGPNLPWTTIRACAKAAFEDLGHEVICDQDGYEQDPWTMTRFSDEGEERIDDSSVSF